MSALRRFTGGALLLLLATLGLSQQTVIITGPRELTGPLTIRVIPPAPAPPPSAPVITTPTPLPDGDINEPYSINLAATGGTLPYSWSLVATQTLPQNTEVWTPTSGDLAFVETFGDSAACAATDNVWPIPAGLVIDNTGRLTGNCSGRIDGTTTAVVESALGLSNTCYSIELIYTALPSTTSTAILFLREVPTVIPAALRWRPSDALQTISSLGGTTQSIFEPLVDTRYKIELCAQRGLIAADAVAEARVAVWNGSSYDAFGAWVQSNDGTWTGLINELLLPANGNGGVWHMDTIERCDHGPPSESCGVGAPDLYETPSPIPNNVYVDGTIPIDESLWSHNGTDLTLEIATDPDLSTIEVAEKPGGTLTLSQSGVLSGTPAADGALNFTARVCDAVGGCSTKAFSLDINAAPDPTPPGPWITDFTPVRTHYVDDVSCGGNGDIGTPECPGTAFNASHYQCGDLHILRAGLYLQTFDYHSEFSRDCTSGSPAVWKAFVSSTGQPENAQFRPQIQQPGAWNWFVNIHVDGEEATQDPTNLIGIKVEDPGNKVINSVLHDSAGSVFQWFSKNTGFATPDMVAYGNVIYGAGPGLNGAHNVYAQNDVAVSGRKYFVHNISMEPRTSVGGRRLFQANDSGGSDFVSGFWLEGNFFGPGTPGDGPSVIFTMHSSVAVPNRDVNFIDNYFVDFYQQPTIIESVRAGAGIALQVVATGNYFARTNMSFNGYWGNSGTHDPMVFTGNEIYDPPDGHIRIVTYGESGSPGTHKFNDADVVDNNTYGGTFKAPDLQCNNSDFVDLSLTAWRTNTNNCRVTPGGAGFDLNSTTVANPTVNKIEVVPNQYQCPSGCPFTDSAWGNIYLVNWENTASDTVDISSVVGVGKQYVVRYPRDFWGPPAASGTCPSSGACNVSLPTRRTSAEATGEFTNAYVITGEP